MDAQKNAGYVSQLDAAALLLAGALMNRLSAMQPAIVRNRGATAGHRERTRMKSKDIGVATRLSLCLFAAMSGCNGQNAQFDKSAIPVDTEQLVGSGLQAADRIEAERCKKELSDLRLSCEQVASGRQEKQEEEPKTGLKFIDDPSEIENSDIHAVNAMLDIAPSALRDRDRKVSKAVQDFATSHFSHCDLCKTEYIQSYAGHKVLYRGASSRNGSITAIVAVNSRSRDPMKPQRRPGRHKTLWLLQYNYLGEEERAESLSHTHDKIDACID
jgi:hypothetical protein